MNNVHIAVGAWDHMEGREEYRSTLAHRQVLVLYSAINTSCTFTTHSLIEIIHTLYRTEETFSAPLFETPNREERKKKTPRHTVVEMCKCA